jgi:excinuclease UvrABC nuclease subunit
MFSKPTSLMLFNRNTICNYIPNTRGVYYLRGIADESSLYPIFFIGRAKNGQLREELLRQCIQKDWPEVVYFNYIECDTEREMKILLKNEIARHKPKYNFQTQTTFIQVPTFKFNRSYL